MTRWFINGFKIKNDGIQKSPFVEFFEKIMNLLLWLFTSILILYFIFK